VVHYARHSAGEKFKPPTERADHERIEAVVSGKDFPLKMVGLIRLFTEQNGMNFGTVEKNHPVAAEFRMEDRDKVDVVQLGGGFPFGPDPDRIQSPSEFPVSFLLVEKIIKVLEGGDQFSRGGFMGEILDGVADGEHRLMVKEMIDVGGWDGFGLATLGSTTFF